MQWTGLNLDECIEFLGESFNGHFHLNRLMIGTLEGEHTASKGDWLIRGVKGEHYPCKPDILKRPMRPLNEEARHTDKRPRGQVQPGRTGQPTQDGR